MKIICLGVILSVLACAKVSAQKSYAEFKSEKDIRRKSQIALDIWNYYSRNAQDSVKIIAIELLEEASDRESKFARAVGTRMLGSYLFRSGDLDQGLEYMIQSRSYFKDKKHHVITSELYNEIGHVLLLKGEFDEAIASYKNSIKVGRMSTDPTARYNGKYGMSRAYLGKGDTVTALKLLNDFKHLAIEQGKYESASDALAMLGQVESSRGNQVLSQDYYYRSQDYSKRSGSKIHLSHSYANLAILKFEQGDLDSSLYYFKESLRLRKELNNLKGIIEGYFNMGDYYNYSGEPKKAIPFFVKSLDLAKEKGMVEDEMDAAIRLKQMYAALGDSIRKKHYEHIEDSIKLEIKNKSGLDQKLIDQIDLDFESNEKKPEDSTEDHWFGWKEFAIVILIIGLAVFFFVERKRFS